MGNNYSKNGGEKKSLHNSINTTTHNSINTTTHNSINTTHNSINTTHKMHLSEPWFTLINLGLKKVEGRLNKGKFKELKDGDIIEWYNDDFKHRSFFTKVVKKMEYISFKEYLNKEGLQNCLPGMPNIEHGLSVYYKYYTKEDETQFGVIAIKLNIIT